MANEPIDVRHVAKLARITLTDDEASIFEGQLNEVMAHIEKLSELDVENIEPTAHATPTNNQVRPDTPSPSLPPNGLLQNAPDQKDNQLRVPKVLDT